MTEEAPATTATTGAADDAGNQDQGSTDSSADSDAGSSYTAPATQADLDKLISERLNRQKSQFRDYDAYKAAAAELEQIKLANQTDAQRKDAEVAKWQTEAEQWRTTAQSSRIQALAADFADPTDAVSALAANNYVDAGGQINDDAINTDLAEILDRKPHWRRPAQSTTPPASRAPAPNSNQGSGGGTATGDPRDQFASLLRSGLTGR